MPTPTVVVTGAGGNIGSNVIRALNSSDQSFYVVGTDADPYYRHLSLADQTYHVPRVDDPSSYISELSTVIEREGADILLPTNIFEIDVIVGHRDDLDVTIPLPGTDATRTFLNKWTSYQQWRDAGVPVPKTVLIETPEDIASAFDKIPGQELWVRGAATEELAPPSGRVFSDPDSIRCWIDMNDGWGRFTASTYLPGDDCTWLGVYDRGELVAGQCRERLDYSESDTWGAGAPTVSKTIDRENVSDLGRSAIETISKEPHGVFFSDMRGGSDETLRVTEVNPGRLGTTSSGFYPRAGFNVPELLVKMAMEEQYEPEGQPNVLPSGLYYLRKLDCGPLILTEDELNA